jgi:hypothetical protein
MDSKTGVIALQLNRYGTGMNGLLDYYRDAVTRKLQMPTPVYPWGLVLRNDSMKRLLAAQIYKAFEMAVAYPSDADLAAAVVKSGNVGDLARIQRTCGARKLHLKATISLDSERDRAGFVGYIRSLLGDLAVLRKLKVLTRKSRYAMDDSIDFLTDSLRCQEQVELEARHKTPPFEKRRDLLLRAYYGLDAEMRKHILSSGREGGDDDAS